MSQNPQMSTFNSRTLISQVIKQNKKIQIRDDKFDFKKQIDEVFEQRTLKRAELKKIDIANQEK
jgi:hypothetical protein